MQTRNVRLAAAGALFFCASIAWGDQWHSGKFQSDSAAPAPAPAVAVPLPGPPAADAPGGPASAGDGYHPFSGIITASGGAPARSMKDMRPFTNFGEKAALDPGASVTAAAAAGPVSGSNEPARPSSRESSDEPAAGESSAPQPVTRQQAAENFPTLVDTYLAENASDGLWLFRDGAKTRPLELVRVDTKRLQSAGKDLYAACAVFRESGAARRFLIEFTADFSGTEWRVISAKPRSKSGPCAN